MKQQRQKDKTIRKILDAAAQIFSEVGFAGARVDDIAEKAGVNKATIYYHIGNKNALYAHMVHDIFGNAIESIESNVNSKKDPAGKLIAYIRGFARFIGGHPYIAALMLREVASGGQHLPEVVAREMAEIVGLLTEILNHGTKNGVFVKTNPFIIHMIIIGSSAFIKASEPIRKNYPMLKNLSFQPNIDAGEIFGDEIEKIILKALKKEDNINGRSSKPY